MWDELMWITGAARESDTLSWVWITPEVLVGRNEKRDWARKRER